METVLRKILLLQLSSLEVTPNPAIEVLLPFLAMHASVEVSHGDNALFLVANNNYHVIVVVDSKIIEDCHRLLWSRLRTYLNNGGLVIVSGYLGLGMPLDEASQIFERVFDLDWFLHNPCRPLFLWS